MYLQATFLRPELEDFPMTPSLPPTAAPPSTPATAAAADGAVKWELPPEVVPDLGPLVTTDDTPVDSIFAEKEQRLFTESLYSSWPGPGPGRRFLAVANVGWFFKYGEPPLVPDGLLSLDVAPGPLDKKEGHSYYQWLMDKPPDVVMEIVSDKRGGEESHKMRICLQQRVLFYVIFDPYDMLKHGVLRVYALQRGCYELIDPSWLPEIGLGLTLWEGEFEGSHATWLRWCDKDGKVIPTGAERVREEARRADEEKRRAEAEARRADEEKRRADEAEEKLKRQAAQLRSLGVEPES
jgi:hypothetical protein